MRKHPHLTAVCAASSLLLVTACGSAEPEGSGEAQDLAATSSSTASPELPGDPEQPDVAGENCIAELARVSNRDASEIRIARVEVDETGPTHFLIIDEATVEWSCDTNPDGSVVELFAMEGE